MQSAKVGVALIAVTPILRILGHLAHVAAFQHRDLTMMPARMNIFMTGCVLALVIGTPIFERFFQRYARRATDCLPQSTADTRPAPSPTQSALHECRKY